MKWTSHAGEVRVYEYCTIVYKAIFERTPSREEVEKDKETSEVSKTSEVSVNPFAALARYATGGSDLIAGMTMRHMA
jgi:hypothetical protein